MGYYSTTSARKCLNSKRCFLEKKCFLCNMVQIQFSHNIKVFWPGNDHYNDKTFLSFLDKNGTLSHWFCPYTLQ